ncbi:diacylglycerol kinase family protein [Aporhodopirellula aestuarii]|uniref:Diacylglycerol kinase family protein n=1 Tax=Aporhodopirellula aestuarii TaxID=2950107 RepID=A0ABT0TY85_9BACT|nr:diacylglycerol kinase family protein [Aporhodopirellula aestuarii]MCM2369540.1 diacylglycerol kinase family protein [Aporhodopirellula aestuarii]
MMPSWTDKFRVAFSGLFWAVRDQSSFHVHLSVTAAVLVLAGLLQLPSWQWAALILAIGLVMTAELLNTAIELLVAVIHPEHDPRVGRALDVAAAGVLFASLTAVAIGVLILGPAIYTRLFAG